MEFGETLTINTHGRRYLIADPGGRIGKRLRNGAPYEKTLLAEIAALRLKGTVVDVGAHVGNHTLFFALACQLNVIAVEPFDKVRNQLYHNLELNAPRFKVLRERVRVVPVALGSERGFGRWDVRINPESQRPNRYLRTDYDLTRDIYDIVPIHQFDELFPEIRGVSLVKLDVEGMEAEALFGMTNMLRRNKPIVYTEVHNDSDHEAIRDVLAPLGYHEVDRGQGSGARMELWRV